MHARRRETDNHDPCDGRLCVRIDDGRPEHEPSEDTGWRCWQEKREEQVRVAAGFVQVKVYAAACGHELAFQMQSPGWQTLRIAHDEPARAGSGFSRDRHLSANQLAAEVGRPGM